MDGLMHAIIKTLLMHRSSFGQMTFLAALVTLVSLSKDSYCDFHISF